MAGSVLSDGWTTWAGLGRGCEADVKAEGLSLAGSTLVMAESVGEGEAEDEDAAGVEALVRTVCEPGE